MFGLFKQKSKRPSVTFKVYKTEIAKYKGLIEYIKTSENPANVVLGYFFSDTGDELRRLIEASGLTIKLIDFSGNEAVTTRSYGELLIAEIHPMAPVFDNAITRFSETHKLSCYASLDNAFFDKIGGGRLPLLMQQLGVEEYDEINHRMIDTAILKAQEKTAKDVVNEVSADSMNQWVEVNLSK